MARNNDKAWLDAGAAINYQLDVLHGRKPIPDELLEKTWQRMDPSGWGLWHHNQEDHRAMVLRKQGMGRACIVLNSFLADVKGLKE